MANPTVRGFNVQDALLTQTWALPNGAATTKSAGFDLEESARGDFVANCEAVISAPALTTTEQPDAKTTIYHIYHSDAADFSGEVLVATLITQTGAGGAGAAAAEARVRLPTTVKRYVRAWAVGSAAGNNSAKSGTFKLAF